jgi:hypothetical protein
MGDHIEVVEQLSSRLIQRMANWQMPGLTEGKILLGREYVDAEQSSPPRVVFVPVRGRYLPVQGSPTSSGRPDGTRLIARPLWSEATDFEVHIWAYDPTDLRKEASIRATQQLARALLCTWYEAGNVQNFRPGSFEWPSQAEGATVREGLGEYLIITLTIIAPVLDESRNFVPQGTKAKVILNPGSGF